MASPHSWHLMSDGDDDDDGFVVEIDDSEEEERENGGDEEVFEIPPNSSRVSEEKDNSAHKSTADEGEGSQKDWNRQDVEGLFCPICLEPWTASGDHQPSCLSCGHLFGMSCIKKWLGQRRNSGKCPQCNKKCSLKDIRRIYGSQVIVVDEESQKRIRSLEAKCDSLEKKDEEWRKKEVQWHMEVFVLQKREAELCQQLQQLKERANSLERSVAELNECRISAAINEGQHPSARGLKFGSTFWPVSSYAFELQQELPVDGARHFDVDDAGQFLITARKPARIGDPHSLTKTHLVSPYEQDNVLLPSAVRDMHLSSFAKLALLAYTGRKLSVLSMESNNSVITYDLPASAWSCSWDSDNSNYIYAGLQNGKLLMFDLRNTGEPLELRNGLTCNPVHTIYFLPKDSPGHTGVKKLLTASQVGVCEWSIGGEGEEWPSLIAETANQGVCISLAHCPSSDNIVATFRPKVGISDDHSMSQMSQCSSFSLGHHVQGSQIFMQRVNSSYQKIGSTVASVPNIRLPKSTIIGSGDGSSVFACGDEATSNLVLRELPSSTVTQRLQSYYPIRDVKYTTSTKLGLLWCLSQEKLQVFSQISL